MSEIKTFQIFRVGSFVSMNGQKVTFDAYDLMAIAVAYKPELQQAPLVLGHPISNEPSYGYVRGLYVEGEALYAQAEVDDRLLEMVRDGRYMNRSASFYLPGMAGNPSPGTYYLRHVGFLGATPPGVKGLPNLDFSEDQQGNPLLADIADRFYCYAEPEGIRASNPLLADAEARQALSINPSTSTF